MSNTEREDRIYTDYSGFTIVEMWDDTAHRKHDYMVKMEHCSSVIIYCVALAISAVITRAAVLNGTIESSVLLPVTRVLMLVGAIGIFAGFGVGFYYQWLSNSLTSTITYQLEHPDGTREDISEREVAAIELGYDRDHFADVPDSEVPCPRCLRIH